MNVVALHSEGGLSTLVPTVGPLDMGGNWQVLDVQGEPLFAGTYHQCDTYMLAEGLRPHCNCELIDVTGDDVAYGWDSF